MESSRIASNKVSVPSGAVLSISELGFSGEAISSFSRPTSERRATGLLSAAWRAGCRYFDTAPNYGFGLSDTRLNTFLRTRSRTSYTLSTKVGRVLEIEKLGLRRRTNLPMQAPSRREFFDYTYDGIFRSLEASLERLGLDYVDIVYVHDLDAITHGSVVAAEERLREFMASGHEALSKLKRDGIVRSIGIATPDCSAANSLLRHVGFDAVLLTAGHFVSTPDAMLSLFEYCKDHTVAVLLDDVRSIINAGTATDHYSDAFQHDAAYRSLDFSRFWQACLGCASSIAPSQFRLSGAPVVSLIAKWQTVQEIQQDAAICRLARAAPSTNCSSDNQP